MNSMSSQSQPLRVRVYTPKPRHNAILTDADLSRAMDQGELRKNAEEILCNGVFLRSKPMFYWLDENTSFSDCYALFASGLTFSDQSNDTWSWNVHQLKGGERSITVAELVKPIRWLEVEGNFSTLGLARHTTYEVSFIVKKLASKTTPTSIIEVVLDLSLALPDGSMRVAQESIPKLDEWHELVAGKFFHDLETIGTIYFRMRNVDSMWKAGIVVWGVHIRPVGANQMDIVNCTRKEPYTTPTL